jgi:hypothetical protein
MSEYEDEFDDDYEEDEDDYVYNAEECAARLAQAKQDFMESLESHRNHARSVAEAMNNQTPEEIAKVMELLPTDVLEWAVRFEALSQRSETWPPV